MKEKFHKSRSQLWNMPTDAQLGIGVNERSHRYLHNSIYHILLEKYYDTVDKHQFMLDLI